MKRAIFKTYSDYSYVLISIDKPDKNLSILKILGGKRLVSIKWPKRDDTPGGRTCEWVVRKVNIDACRKVAKAYGYELIIQD